MSLLLETNVFSQKSDLISKIESASFTSESKTEGQTLTVSSQMVNSARIEMVNSAHIEFAVCNRFNITTGRMHSNYCNID
jgi:hypothetical protein